MLILSFPAVLHLYAGEPKPEQSPSVPTWLLWPDFPFPNLYGLEYG